MQQHLFDKSVIFSDPEAAWATPPEVFGTLDKAFGGFDLDVCANDQNAKCPAFIDPECDTIDPSVRWRGRCWMNPPYGAGIELFLDKANREVQRDMQFRSVSAKRSWTRVVCLLPTNFESSWFRLYCQQWPFLVWPERIKFIHPDGHRGERPANGNVVVAMGYSVEELPHIEFYKKREGRFPVSWFVSAK